MSGQRGIARWPLFLIASPAAVAIWSGWVGLGGLCGFGPIHPLPGIAGGIVINTAITLPIGVEAYGAYALRAWLTPGVPERAQRFAKASALGALALGMCGQVIYHLLAAVHAVRAPWPVTMLVSCVPVITLGFGAALTHLLRIPAEAESKDAVSAGPEGVSEGAPAGVSDPEPVPAARYGLNGHGPEAERLFAAEIEAGEIPSIRRIRAELHVGQPRAREVQAHLETLTPAGRSIRRIRDGIRQGAEVNGQHPEDTGEPPPDN